MLNFQTRLLINGTLVNGNGTLEKIINPSTGVIITHVAEASLEQIQLAVASAASAFKSWKKPPLATAQPCY